VIAKTIFCPVDSTSIPKAQLLGKNVTAKPHKKRSIAEYSLDSSCADEQYGCCFALIEAKRRPLCPVTGATKVFDVKLGIFLQPEECTMKSLGTNSRLMFVFALVFLVLVLAPQYSLAQTVSVSPVELTFGIPTGTPGTPPVSAAAAVTLAITGASSSSPVTFGAAAASVGYNSPSLGTDKPTDFIIAPGSSCNNATFTSPTTAYCQVSVTFSDSIAPGSNALETAMLTVNYSINSTAGSLTVPMNGAYGAIKLFASTTVATSSSTASFTTPTIVGYSPQNLSCPAGTPISAVLSNTPDGLGYVLMDNYITLSISGQLVVNPVPSAPVFSPAGNVCTGGVQDYFSDMVTGGNVQQDCFSQAYRNAAISNTVSGDFTDFLTNPGNSLLSGAAGGVPPINISSFFPSSDIPTPLPVAISLLDAGGYVASSSLFLVTNCSPAGIAPGGSITGNPTPTNTLTFSSAPGAGVTLVDSTANNPPPNGTTPIVTDIAIPQQLFYQLVQGTSSAPSVCFRMSAELDYTVSPPAPMCKGFLIQCQYTDPTTGITTTTGDNCDPTSNSVRDIYDTILFDSPDGPANGHNYLYTPVGSPAADACSHVVPGGSCAVLTGPGLLMGGDAWLCGPGAGQVVGCTPEEPNTTTNTSPPSYTAANCVLTGGVAGDLCPLNTLTAFYGASDPGPVGGTKNKNSILIPVANLPLPYALAFINNGNNGWVNSTPAQVSFIATPALYLGGSKNPPANSFKPAPLYSVTFGTTLASMPLPDTTSPIPTDTTLYNLPYANPNFGAPLCESSTPLGLFSPTGSTSMLSNGTYNLHFFATDCALSEGLIFLPTGSQLSNPTANWASFESVIFGVDTTPPSLSINAPTPPSGTNYKKNSTGPTVYFSCLTGGPSGLRNCGTSLGANLPATGYPPAGPGSYTSSVKLPTTNTGTINVTFYARSEAGLETTYVYTYIVY